MLLTLRKKVATSDSWPVLDLGFRPFFLGAALFAVASIALWSLYYFNIIPLGLVVISGPQWHSHEMIYGYTIAVVAGFLLTAVSSWTGIQTIRGYPLGALFSLWMVARISFFWGERFILLAGVFDLLFMVSLFATIARPIVIAREWTQSIVLLKVLLLILANLAFYLGAGGLIKSGIYWGLYGGLYAIVGLILVIGGRVIPPFTMSGVPYPVTISTPRWIQVSGPILFLFFMVNQLFVHHQPALALLSILLCTVNTVRLFHWHTPGIWRAPLLWSLYLSIAFINLGFLLSALAVYTALSPFLAVHAFAVGGIGLATLGMMSRVSLGHTGRRVKSPPTLIAYALILLTIGALTRVVLPIVAQPQYGLWILLSQIAWIVAFSLFLLSHCRMLITRSLGVC